jgi:hypothetical protein
MRWSFLPVLMEDVQVVLHLCEPRSLPIDVLPVSFDALNCSLPSLNVFLFLLEPQFLTGLWLAPPLPLLLLLQLPRPNH